LQGLAPQYRLRRSWTQWIGITTTTTTTIIILKGNWINIHNIAVMTEDSIVTTNAKYSTIIRSVDNGEESRYLLGFKKDYVEPKPNVNNDLDVPSIQP